MNTNALRVYSEQSTCSDPRQYAQLFDKLPLDIRELTSVIRNVILHYRAGGIDLSPGRMSEIDNRWIDRLLATDQQRFDTPLDAPRPIADRVAGCCRDFTLLTVAALRHRGIPARSRIGFAGYFVPPWHHDHVIVDYWDGERWVFLDPQLDPAAPWDFDPADMPRLRELPAPPVQPFVTAAQVWTAYRRGEIDDQTYGVDASLPFRGGWFIRNYVISELAHRQRDELLLWDMWGAMSMELDGDLGMIDDVAGLLLAADAGADLAERDAAEHELAKRYATDDRLHPTDQIISMSPTEHQFRVNLPARTSVPAESTSP